MLKVIHYLHYQTCSYTAFDGHLTLLFVVYLQHDNRNDDQSSASGRGRRRSAGRDNVSQATPARWGHDMFDRYYGEDQTPPPEDEQDQGQAPRLVCVCVCVCV